MSTTDIIIHIDESPSSFEAFNQSSIRNSFSEKLFYKIELLKKYKQN